MVNQEKELRELVIKTARSMNALGINVNKGGNVSVRARVGELEGFWITPTGIAYEDLVAQDIVFVALDGLPHEEFAKQRKASSEWLMHAEVYRHRKDFRAMVNTNSEYATALACQDICIRAIDNMVAVAGGNSIKCEPHALFGSEGVPNNAAAAL